MNEVAIDTKLQTQIEAAITKTNELTVDTQEKLTQATDIVKFIKEKAKQVEAARKELVDPLNAHVKNINARFKALSEPLDAAEANLKGKILTFQRKLEAELRAEEERKRKEAEAEAKAQAEAAREIGLESQAAMIEASAALVAKNPIAIEKVRGGFTGAVSSIVKRWKADVIDSKLLAQNHPELVLPNMVAINKLISSGVRELAGVEIKQEESLAIR